MFQERRGEWFQVFSGRQFWPESPQVVDIDILDIASALGKICRFNGHCREFYSVAQHSVHVAMNVPIQFALLGLLHDAAEAYVGDMIRPMKRIIHQFERIEERVHFAICDALDVSRHIPAEVRKADDVLLATEYRDLMRASAVPWGLKEQPLEDRIRPWSPDQSTRKFLELYEQLRDQ